MKQLIAIVTGLLLTLLAAIAAENLATLRGAAELNDQGKPAIMPKVENKDIKRKRDYPMQPPTIPHKVRDYQVDRFTNKCLSCHSRKRTEESQAPMVSVTHYMDRDGNFLADVSPRRYFCSQCHVVQLDARPLVENEFKDVDELLKGNKPKR